MLLPLSGSCVLFTPALTHIFEGQHNGCNDAGHKNYDPKDTEKALALCEVHLGRETTGGHVNTRVTAQIHCGHLKLISTRTLTHINTHTPYLCLEAEDGDGDADDGSDTQSEKHCLCVIVAKNKEQHTLNSKGNSMFIHSLVDRASFIFYLEMDPVM